MTSFDAIIVGGGLRGLHHALRIRAQRPGDRVLVVESEAWPGDDVRTQRSNGFTCELGPFAFSRDEIKPLLEPLPQPPRIIDCNEEGRTGWLFDGKESKPLHVEPEPCSFATGCEDIVQAYRRELGSSLRLGRAAMSVKPADNGGFVITLGGEVPTELRTTEVVFATSATAAARTLGSFDPELPHVANQGQLERRAFAWFGGLSKDTPELRGYGILPHPEMGSPLAELIFCTHVFPNRAMPDRCLLRAETALAEVPEDDRELTHIAEEEVRRWTGTNAKFGFTKVHRFTTIAPDGALAECRNRINDIVGRVPGMQMAP